MQGPGLCVAVAAKWLYLQAGRCRVGPGDAHPWFSVLGGLEVGSRRKELALGAP